MTPRDEGNDILSIYLFDSEVITVTLDELKIGTEFDPQFYKINYSKSTNEMILLGEYGLYLFSLNLKT